MGNSVLIMWLEGIHPDRLGELHGFTTFLAHGIDVQLKPQPLVELHQCRYQLLTGMGAGKFGRFDAVRPEKYTAHATLEVPEGVHGHALLDILRARKLNVYSTEVTGTESIATLRHLKTQAQDVVLLHVRDVQQLDTASLDALLNQCIEAIPASHIVMLTDVAVGSVIARVNINTFLAEVGLMEMVDGSSPAAINWNETLAYGLGTGQVWVNLRGREAQGTVRAGREFQEVCNALIQELTTNWLDPQTRQPIVEHVYKKEELYTGDYLFKAPDLTVVYRPGYVASERAFALAVDEQSVLHVQSLAPLLQKQVHAPYARMLASGPSFERPTERTQASSIDFLPTMLFLLGQAIPQYVDGSVIEPIFTQMYRQQTPIKRVEDEADQLSDEEEGMIVDRLRDLGYLG